MSTGSKDAKITAEARKKAQALEGAQAMADYQAERRAVEEKTARLKALRLAKEAADAAAAAKQPPSPGKKRRS